MQNVFHGHLLLASHYNYYSLVSILLVEGNGSSNTAPEILGFLTQLRNNRFTLVGEMELKRKGKH